MVVYTTAPASGNPGVRRRPAAGTQTDNPAEDLAVVTAPAAGGQPRASSLLRRHRRERAAARARHRRLSRPPVLDRPAAAGAPGYGCGTSTDTDMAGIV